MKTTTTKDLIRLRNEHGVLHGKGYGYVYLIHCTGSNKYKIGMSQYSSRSRLNTMQTGCPFKLDLIRSEKVQAVKEVEAMLHGAFNGNHWRGEWFSFGKGDINRFDDIIKYCNGLV